MFELSYKIIEVSKSSIVSNNHHQVKEILDQSAEIVHFTLIKSPTVSKYYLDALDFAKDIDTRGLVGPNGEINSAKMQEIDNLLKEKTKNGKLISSRAQACSLAAVCVVAIYVVAFHGAAVAVSVAAGVAVAIYAGVYLWTGATVYRSGTPIVLPAPKQPRPGSNDGLLRTDFSQSDYDQLQKEMLINEITVKFALLR